MNICGRNRKLKGKVSIVHAVHTIRISFSESVQEHNEVRERERDAESFGENGGEEYLKLSNVTRRD